MEIYNEIKIFCENIKKFGEINCLSKTKMAQKLGISVKSLNMIESRELPKRLSAKVVITIYNNFGIRPKDLFSRNLF